METRIKAFWEKVRMTVLFIFVPEMMVWYAASQWQCAEELRHALLRMDIGVCCFPSSISFSANVFRTLICLKLGRTGPKMQHQQNLFPQPIP